MQVLVWMNSYSSGTSGGDQACIAMLQRLPGPHKLRVVTSQLGAELCRSQGLVAEYALTTREVRFGSVLATYLARLCWATWYGLRLPRCQLVYVSSDILCDVWGALVYYLRQRLTHPFASSKICFVQKSFHMNPRHRRLSYWMQRLSFKLLGVYTDRLTTCSPHSLKQLTKLRVAPGRLGLTYVGYDLEKLGRSKSMAHDYQAICVARLHESKGIFDLVSIWQQVVEINPSAKLALIGSGHDHIRQQLTAKIASAGLQHHFHLLGFQKDIYPWLKGARLFVFPSHEEGFGIVIAEALACGLPVVAYDLEVYQGLFQQGVRQVPLGHHKAFAKEVLASLEQAPGQVKASGEAGREVFSWQSCSDQEWGFLAGWEGG